MSNKLDSVIREVLITSVTTRQVGARNSTMWTVATQGGPELTTFNASIGNKCLALQGQVVDLKVTIEQKDQYTNYYVNDVQASLNQAGAAVLNAAATAAGAAQTIGQQDISLHQFSALEDKKTESIHRQTAAKVAAVLTGSNGSAHDFWANVGSVLHFFKTGENPLEAQTTIATPWENSSGVTSHSDPGPEWPEQQPQDDDIPF